tara:strand:- start:1059 stop:2519 length:1461 start_codon:yes stop_codon:yes gene_type:complete
MIKIVTTIKSGMTSIVGCNKQKKKAMEEVSEKIDKIQQDLKVGISDRDKKSEEFNEITRKNIAAISKKEAEDIDHMKNKIKETQKQLAINKEVSKENKAGTKAVNNKLDEFAREHMGLSGEVNDVRDDVRKLERRLSSLDRDVSDLKGGRENDSSKMGLGKLSDVPIEYDEVTKIEKSVYNQQPVRRLYRTIREIITIAEKQERKIKESKVLAAKKIESEARKKADSVIEEAGNKVETAIEKIRLERSEVLLEDSMLAKLVVEKVRYQEAAYSLLKAAESDKKSIKRAQDNLNKAKNKKGIAAEDFKKAKNCLSKTRGETAQAVAEGASRSLDAQSAVDKLGVAEKALDVLEKETFLIDSHQCEKWKKICENNEEVGLGYWGDYPSDVSLNNGLIPEKELKHVNGAIAILGNLNINLNPYDREDSQVVPIEDAHGRLLYNIMDILGIMKVAKMSERYERQDGYKKSGGINDHLVNIIREYINPDKN